MRKVLIIVVILFVLIGSLMPIASFLVQQGVRNRDKPWAAHVAAAGTRMQMYMMRYPEARASAESVLQSFPDYRRADRMVYYVALCHEKEGEGAGTTAQRDASFRKSIEWYQIFLTRWPSHGWADAARRRMTTLEAGGL